MTDNQTPKAWRKVTGHVAVRALLRSVLINMVAPAILYQWAGPHFAPTSLIPLAISGTPPILWLLYGVIKLGAIDFLGLFATENTIVRITSLLLAHDEQGALIGRAMENVILAAIFLASLAFAKPLVFYMSRQLSTGNDPVKRSEFDLVAAQPKAMKAYRVLTLGWTLALLIKAAGSYFLATHLSTKNYLLFSPLWDLVGDSMLVTWSLLYGRMKITSPTTAISSASAAAAET